MPATLPQPNQAVLDARARRPQAGAQDAINIEWYIKNVSDKVTMTMRQRMQVTLEYLRSKVVKNISLPVGYSISKTGRKYVSQRSVPGEYPRAETTMLMKTVFTDIKEKGGQINGYIGSPMDYAIPLELEMDRSFLVRTLNEERSTITRLLTGPIA